MDRGLRPPSTSIDSAGGSKMAPSTLDLFILTFNCAKTLINVPVFASHLHASLLQNATDLPDLVVFSLQEVAPISYAFIGSYFLGPYFARFGDALNLASERVLATTDSGSDDGHVFSAPQTTSNPSYTLVRAKNVGMTAILLYARDPTSVGNVEEAECGFGAADMGNKGAVGLRVTWSGAGGGARGQTDDDYDAAAAAVTATRSTELTFVATHLAAMEWNLKKRNSNWRSIVSSLTFANPRSILPGVFPDDTSAVPTRDRSGAGDTAPRLPTGDSSTSASEQSSDDDDVNGEDAHPLLPPLHDEAYKSTLQSISIFKPTSHLFLAGDLNYRISSSTPPPLSTFPSFDPASPDYFPGFLARDQLTRERLANRTCHGLSESPIAFGPTYKFDILPSADGADNADAVRAGSKVNGLPEVPWRFARHRWPGWCDRVLWLDVAPWVRGKKREGIETTLYDALPVVATSDHKAVVWRGKVPVLGADEMRVPDEAGADVDDAWRADPRVELPVPVDVHAWERRVKARQKEVLVGWSAFLWSTREGALVLATALALGIGGWWLLRG
ncbi:hypothetical protein MMYC01_204914 [Madurella mycetomatis]|uniref:Inositol polyphosphate-related phosphatase domain-containing protein n=1 Tax=Madurella mycetomatis TaxID=100816 RepID=A0A175W4A2_9PEZI|nr:hypothetical protein MMYC01_204914 [Madurella mycetomatis]